MAKKNEEAADEKEVAQEQDKDTKHIKVKSTLKSKPDGGAEVALYESHKAHPGGEAYVAGEEPVEVAETPAVLRAISEGKLVKV